MSRAFVQSNTHGRLKGAGWRLARRQGIWPCSPRACGHHRSFHAQMSDRGVLCQWPDSSTETLFPYIWLRDACQGATSVHPSAKQKLFRTSDVPSAISAKDIEVTEKDLTVHWSQPLSPTPASSPEAQPHTSVFSSHFLRRYASRLNFESHQHQSGIEACIWKRKDISERLSVLEYSTPLKADAKLKAAEALQQDGIALFRSVSTGDQSEANCELVKLAEQLGDVRTTWYGKTFDVKSLKAAKNIAYTNLVLGFHQDLVHFDDPPRYQFLHFLYGHPTLRGGLSRFVDSYAVAAELKKSNPGAYQALSECPVAFEYKNDGRWRYAERTTLEHDEAGRLVAVNYSPPFQGPLPLHRLGEDGVALLRDSLEAFDTIAEDERWTFELTMAPGDCVGFDNRRVLHARTAFNFEADAHQVGRHLKGLYVEGDSVRETYRVLSEALC